MESNGPRSESSSAPNERQTDGSFSIEGISVTAASTDRPGAYEYEDLKRGSDTSTLLTHAVFWPIYLLVAFPIQYLIRILLWGFWRKRHVWHVPTRLQILFREATENLHKLRFLLNPDRRAVYLRASRVYTPAQVFPHIAGTKPIPEDPSSKRQRKSGRWDRLRKQVYERDEYTCVNCGAEGGPNGSTELHADHVLPSSRDGSDTSRNLRTLCRECHEARHARNFD